MKMKRKIETQKSVIKKYKKIIESDGQVTVKKEQGITLIALVVTIIIMLILAGVALSMALGENGLISQARFAANKTTEAKGKEQQTMNGAENEIDKIIGGVDYNEYVGAYVTGYSPEAPGCTIAADISGDANDQTFKADLSMGWRIWDYDKNTKTLRLISSRPTAFSLTLSNINGYNNGVWAINEICRKCYSNEDKDIGITVANLRRTDIQKVSNYNYQKYKHKPSVWVEDAEDTAGDIHFGETKSYSANFQYPELWKKDRDAWKYTYTNGSSKGKDDESIWEIEYGGENITGQETGDSSTQFKQSYYCHDYIKENNEFKKDIYYDLIFCKEDGSAIMENAYWLAGRCVQLYETNCYFGIQKLDAYSSRHIVCGHETFWSNGNKGAGAMHLRPMVSIDLDSSGYELVKQINDDVVSFVLTK